MQGPPRSLLVAASRPQPTPWQRPRPRPPQWWGRRQSGRPSWPSRRMSGSSTQSRPRTRPSGGRRRGGVGTAASTGARALASATPVFMRRWCTPALRSHMLTMFTHSPNCLCPCLPPASCQRPPCTLSLALHTPAHALALLMPAHAFDCSSALTAPACRASPCWTRRRAEARATASAAPSVAAWAGRQCCASAAPRGA